MMRKKKEMVAGIDVGAAELVVAGLRDGARLPLAHFDNDPSGHKQLIRWLTKGGRNAQVGLEATGVYSLDLAIALHRAPRVAVMVVNPRAVHNFAKASLQRGKTDAMDATVILEFTTRMPFVAWQPPPPESLELRTMARRINALTKMLSQERNRLHAAAYSAEGSLVVRRDIEVTIRHFERRIALLSGQAEALIPQHRHLREAFEHLVSVRGIATASATQILAELGVLPSDMTVRQWVAHAGLDPRPFNSGTSVHKPARVSKAGNKYLRAALYMPALVAIQHEPNVRAFYEKLVAGSKKPMQANVAVMRKLLHSIYGMLRTHQDFDGEKFFAMAA
jgi:transposase